MVARHPDDRCPSLRGTPDEGPLFWKLDEGPLFWKLEEADPLFDVSARTMPTANMTTVVTTFGFYDGG